MEKKVEVKLIKTPKDIDSFLEEICCIEQFQREREEKLKDMFHDFEVYLLNEAIKLKSRFVYVVSHTEYVYLKNGARIDTIYESFVDKDLADSDLLKAKEKDHFAIMMDYHFDKLLDMRDNEFDEFPDLGAKGLQRKYREIMREA